MNNLSKAKDIVEATSLLSNSTGEKYDLMVDGKLTTYDELGFKEVHNLANLESMLGMQRYMDEFKEKNSILAKELEVSLKQTEELKRLIKEALSVPVIIPGGPGHFGFSDDSEDRLAYGYRRDQIAILNTCTFTSF